MIQCAVWVPFNVSPPARAAVVPGALLRAAEVPAGVVVSAGTPAAGSAPGCHGVGDRAPRPRRVAQSVGDHAPVERHS